VAVFDAPCVNVYLAACMSVRASACIPVTPSRAQVCCDQQYTAETPGKTDTHLEILLLYAQ